MQRVRDDSQADVRGRSSRGRAVQITPRLLHTARHTLYIYSFSFVRVLILIAVPRVYNHLGSGCLVNTTCRFMYFTSTGDCYHYDACTATTPLPFTIVGRHSRRAILGTSSSRLVLIPGVLQFRRLAIQGWWLGIQEYRDSQNSIVYVYSK